MKDQIFFLSLLCLGIGQTSNAAVNLVINSGVVPASMNRGSTYSITITVRNTGTTSTSVSFPVNISINSASTYNGSQTYLADFWINGGIASMQNKSVQGTITIPCTYATGTKFILASADPTNLVAESSNSDNDASYGVLIHATAIDLVPLNYSLTPNPVTAGSTVTANFAVNNTGGTATANGFNVGFYLSTSTTLVVAQAVNLGSQAVAALPGCSQTVAINKPLTIPSNTCGDTYYLFMWIDNGQTIPESGDANNFQYIALTVNGASPPATPTALSANNLTPTSFNARWNSASGATGYRLDVATNSSFSAMVPGYADLGVGGVLNYGVTGLVCNTAYYYRVRGSHSCATGSNSNTITAQSSTGLPGIPSQPTISGISGTSFIVNWIFVGGSTGYYLDVATNSSFSSMVPGYNNLAVGNVASRSVTGLSCCVTYYTRVRASNACGTGSSSPSQLALTSACACSYDLNPGGGTSVSFLASSGQVTVDTEDCCSWSASCTTGWVQLAPDVQNGILAYHVEVNTSPSQRTATVDVEGELFNITQAPNPVPAIVRSPLPSVAQYTGVLQSNLPWDLYSFSLENDECIEEQYACSTVFFQTPYVGAPTIPEGKTPLEYIPRAKQCFGTAQIANRWEFRQRGFITENYGIMCNTIACPLNQSIISHSANACGQKDDRYAWDVNLATGACDALISVYAVEEGMIDRNAGSHIRIRHTTPNGDWYSYYDNIDITPDLPGFVLRGREIGVIKNTTTYEPHLHFGVYYRSAEEDPDAPIVSVNRLIEPEYENPLTQEEYELGSLKGECSGSVLSSASIFIQRSGRWSFGGKTDENGRFDVTVIPALDIGDSVRVEATGYETLSIALGADDIQAQRMTIPMLSSSASPGVKNAKVAVLANAPYFSTPSVQLAIGGEGYVHYDVLRVYDTDDSMVTLPLSMNHDVSEPTVSIILPDTGMNVVGVYFRGADSVLVTQELEYLPSLPNYALEILSDNSSVQAKLYVDDRFIKRVTEVSETFPLSDRDHLILVSKQGYRDTTFTVDSASVVNLSLTPLATELGMPCDSTIIDFVADERIQHRNGVTIMDDAQQSVISFKQCHEEFGDMGLIPKSKRLDFRRLSTVWSPLRFAAALDQEESLSQDSVYLMTVRNDTIFQKTLFTANPTLVAFDSLSQKVSCNHLGDSGSEIVKESVVVMKRKAPIVHAIPNLNFYQGSTVTLPLSTLFSDPDSLPGDLNYTMGVVDDNLGLSLWSDTVSFFSMGDTGAASFTILAEHDGLIDSATVTVIINSVPRLLVSPRVFLGGPYDPNSQRMSDSLRVRGLLPFTEPYTGLGYEHHGGGGGEFLPLYVLNFGGPSAVVDWIVVELREAQDPSHVLQSRSALLHRDGAVTDSDGFTPVEFTGLAGDYYVAVRHRNHLGAMTLNAVALSDNASTIDFTSSDVSTYGTNARVPSNGVMLLWAGNTLWDTKLKYAGPSNDRDPILVRIGGSVPTSTFPGYHREDVNLDGVVKYAGSRNDRDPILVNIGGMVPTATRVEQLP